MSACALRRTPHVLQYSLPLLTVESQESPRARYPCPWPPSPEKKLRIREIYPNQCSWRWTNKNIALGNGFRLLEKTFVWILLKVQKSASIWPGVSYRETPESTISVGICRIKGRSNRTEVVLSHNEVENIRFQHDCWIRTDFLSFCEDSSLTFCTSHLLGVQVNWATARPTTTTKNNL